MTSAKRRGGGGGTSVTTRGAASSAAAVEKRMDVEELVKFLQQVESLPCKVPEASALQVHVCICTCTPLNPGQCTL